MQHSSKTAEVIGLQVILYSDGSAMLVLPSFIISELNFAALAIQMLSISVVVYDS